MIHYVTKFVCLLLSIEQVEYSGFITALAAAKSCLLWLKQYNIRAVRRNQKSEALVGKLNNELKFTMKFRKGNIRVIIPRRITKSNSLLHCYYKNKDRSDLGTTTAIVPKSNRNCDTNKAKKGVLSKQLGPNKD